MDLLPVDIIDTARKQADTRQRPFYVGVKGFAGNRFVFSDQRSALDASGPR